MTSPIRFFTLLLAAAFSSILPLARAQTGMVNVTFDVTLPASTPGGDTIYVTGNFQNWDPAATPLTRDSATHAFGTVTVTQGYALQFKFTRGDFARVEKGATCAEITNRMATADSDMTIVATVDNWADNCVAIYDSRATKVHLDNTVLGVAKEFYVYTPPGYAQAYGKRYPAIYFFRGHEREWINKFEDDTRGGRNVIDVYLDLLAAGQVGPMIFVFPGISSNDNSVSGMVTNFKSPGLTTAAGIGNGRFEDYLLTDVMGYVDAHYRTVASKAGRGVDGFSLGGFMSIKIAAQHPELFATVGAFDGTHFYSRISCSDVDIADQTFLNSMFDPVFGNPRDTAFAALNNGPSLVCNATAASMQSVHWFVQYGPLASEPNDSNYLRGDHLVQKLTAKNVTNEITPVLAGGHHWATADEHMRQTLPLHWGVLKAAAVSPLQIDAIAKETNGRILVQGSGAPLQAYNVEISDSPGGGYAFLATVTADAAGLISYEDGTAANFTHRFYRFTPPAAARARWTR